MNYIEINNLKRHCIDGLRDVSIENVKKLVSLASDVLALLNISIRLSKLSNSVIGDELKHQINEKYNKINEGNLGSEF